MDFEGMMSKREEMKSKAVEFVTAGSFKKDERFWEVTTGKDGNGSAIFRFLPQPNFDLNPVVRRMRHTFKLKGKQFFDYCPKTLDWDEECPVCDEIGPLYDEYVDTPKGKKYTYQTQIDLLKRRNEHITNIYMIDDPGNPENNGKVFLFRMNGVIIELYQKAINPPAEMIKPKFVYDYIEGCNFQYIVIGPTKKGDFNDYKSSTFSSSTPIADTQEKMKEIWDASYDLAEFIDAKLFKSFDDINKNFRKIYFNEAVSRDIPGGLPDQKSTQMDHPFGNDTKISDPVTYTSELKQSTQNDFSFDTPDPNIKSDTATDKKIEDTNVDDGFKF